MDRHELELLTRDELLGLARSAGIDGVEWLSREELVATLSRGSTMGRTRGIFDKARALIDKARELGRTLRASRPPEPVVPPPPPPPAPPAPATAGSFETMTMAEVLAAQGHVEEARRIVLAILGRDPDHPGARALLARLPPPAKSPEGPEPPASYDEDAIGMVLLGPTTLYVYWEVTEEGVGRARGLLREEGPLVLRVSTATVAGVTTQDEPVSAIGDRVLEDAPPDTRHRAAVGLLAGSGRFVPIVHSPAVTTPPAGPSTDARLEWVELALPAASAEVRRPTPGASKSAEPRAVAEARRQAEPDTGAGQ
jgi:hypothetical protein